MQAVTKEKEKPAATVSEQIIWKEGWKLLKSGMLEIKITKSEPWLCGRAKPACERQWPQWNRVLGAWLFSSVTNHPNRTSKQAGVRLVGAAF